ncbi:hypothetical protein PFISCL1PPCAC_20590, partial [Pristionchus fissidentatus]
MSQPLTFSDDEDTNMFSKQLQEVDVARLIPRPQSYMNAIDKENLAWRTDERVKTERDSLNDTFSFSPSPVKRGNKIVLDDAHPDREIKPELLDEDDAHQKPVVENDRLTPGKACKDEFEADSEWKVVPLSAKRSPLEESAPINPKTPRSAASTRRRRILNKIKAEMAENQDEWAIDHDQDFVFLGKDDDLTPTPFRLRSANRRSRVTYRNLDWSSEANDRKRNRRSALFIDESEEEREMEREREREREKEEKKKRMVRKRKQTREDIESVISSSSSSAVPDNAFSLSDDESIAVITSRMKMEERMEEGDGEYRGVKKRKIKKEVNEETAFSLSDDEPIATISKRMKDDGGVNKRKIKEEVNEESAFSLSDDEPIASIAKRMKDDNGEDRGDKREIKKEMDEESSFSLSDDDSIATIAKKMGDGEEEERGAKKRKIK